MAIDTGENLELTIEADADAAGRELDELVSKLGAVIAQLKKVRDPGQKGLIPGLQDAQKNILDLRKQIADLNIKKAGMEPDSKSWNKLDAQISEANYQLEKFTASARSALSKVLAPEVDTSNLKQAAQEVEYTITLNGQTRALADWEQMLAETGRIGFSPSLSDGGPPYPDVALDMDKIRTQNEQAYQEVKQIWAEKIPQEVETTVTIDGETHTFAQWEQRLAETGKLGGGSKSDNSPLYPPDIRVDRGRIAAENEQARREVEAIWRETISEDVELNIRNTADLADAQKRMAALEESVKRNRENLLKFRITGDDTALTREAEKLRTTEELLRRYQAAISAAQRSWSQLDGTGTIRIQTVEDLEAAERAARRLEKSIENDTAALRRFSAASDAPGVERMKARLEASRSALERYKTALAGTGDIAKQRDNMAALADLQARMEKIQSQIGSSKSGEQMFLNNTAKVRQLKLELVQAQIQASRLNQALGKISVATGASEQMRMVAKNIGMAVAHMVMLHRESRQVNRSIINMSRTLSLMAFRFAVRTIMRLTREGIQNLAMYSKETDNAFNSAMSAMMSKVTQLKNSFAAAVAPIIQMITPYVVQVLNIVIDFFNTISLALASLFGQETFYKAQPVAEDYAESLNTAAGNAKELKRQLLGIDELNILQDNTKDSTDPGRADVSDMFTIEKVADHQDTLNAFKKKLDEILPIVKTIGNLFIAWKLGSAIFTGLSNLNQLLNGTMSSATLLKGTLGALAIAAGITLGISNIKAILDGEYKNVSKESFIKTALSGVLTGLGLTLFGASAWAIPIAAVFSFAITDVVVNWENYKAMAQDLATALEAFWNGDDSTFWESVSDAWLEWMNADSWLIKLAERIVGEDAWNSVKAYLENGGSFGDFIAPFLDSFWDTDGDGNVTNIEKLKKLGKAVVEGFFTGIMEAALDPTKTILNYFIDPIINTVKALLGINGTGGSTEFKDVGEDCVEGFESGVKSSISEKLSSITSVFADTILPAIKRIFGITDTRGAGRSSVFEAMGEDCVDGFEAGIDSGMKTKQETILAILGLGLVQLLKNKLGIHSPSTVYQGVGENIVQGLWNGLSDKWTALKEWWQNLSLPEFKIKTPHLSWSTQEATGWIAKTLSAIGLPTSIPKLNVSWYAQGGFPTMGELFVARESGPELVGRMGGRTAVANNDQIVAGIATGVRDANTDVVSAVYAMARQVVTAIESSGGDIYMDSMRVGEMATNAQNRRARMYGKSLQYT